jgi:PAS domain S-box-containing protein
LGALRLILGIALAIYALTFAPIAGHQPSAVTEPAALLLACSMILSACLQLSPSLRPSTVLARVCLMIDLVSVLGTLALYAPDPRGNLLILVPAIQAEGGVVLGLPGGFWVWGASSAGYVGAEALSQSLSGNPVSTIDLALRIVVGFVLTVGGGILCDELSEERRRADEARELELDQLQRLVGRLGEAEERYRVLVEQTPALLYIHMPNDEQTPVYIGPQIESIIGVSQEQYLADPHTWGNLVHPDDRQRTTTAYAEAVRLGGTYSDEYRLVRPDGRTVWLHDEAAVLHDANGDPSLVHGVMFDITDRHVADEREQRDRAYAEALSETALAAMQRLDPSHVLDTILGRSGALVGTVHGYVYADADGDGFEVKAGMGLFKEWFGFRLHPGEGVPGRVSETARPVLVDDYDSWEGRASSFPRGIFHSVVGVPLISGAWSA